MSIKGFPGKMRNIFRKEKRTVLVLEIGQERIKAAVSRQLEGQRKIINLTTRSIAGKDKAATADIIKDLLAELKLGHATIVVSLPRHSVTLRYMRLPSTDPAEIKNIAELQVIKQLPYHRDDIIISHKVLEKDTEGYSKVMLVAVHKSVITKLLGILKMSGLEPTLVALSSEAINRYSSLMTSLPILGADQAMTLIDMDGAFTEIQIHRRGNVVFSRSLHHGLEGFEDRDKRSAWIDEIKLSFSTYAREKGSSEIAYAVLTGAAWKKEGTIDKVLGKELKMPIEVVYPLTGVRITPGAEAKFSKADYLVSFSSVIALALNYEQLDINLLPSKVKLLQKKRLKYRNLINIGILAACVILALSLFMLKKLHDKQVYLRLLKIKLKSIAPEAEVLNKKAKMARMVKDHLRAEGSCLDILRETYAVTPRNVYLTKFIYDKGKGITLKGSSPNMSQVFKFITVLEGSEYFKNVQLKYASKRKRKDVDLTDFEIYASLR